MPRSRRGKLAELRPKKVIDDADPIRSASGRLTLRREEVWVDNKNKVVRYNLAYIDHHICQVDNGRVIGYDNAHGFHERHRMGKAEEVPFVSYPDTVEQFDAEIRTLREDA